VIAEELQVARCVRRDQLLQEQSSEQAGEHADGEEEAGPARHPAPAVERDAVARYDHVDVRDAIGMGGTAPVTVEGVQ
jgi:hypothetical protein